MATIIQRIQELVSANVHDLLSKAEDPEKMANEYLRQLNDQFYEAKTEVAQAMADETRLEQKWLETQGEAKRYETLAEQALRAGREDLAKRALTNKVRTQKVAEQYEQQYRAQEDQVDELQEGLASLEARIAETQAQRDLIVAKHNRVKTQKPLQAAAQGLSKISALGKMDQLEDKLDNELAKLQAMSELSGSDPDIEGEVSDVTVDSELAELKQKLGM